MLEGCHDGFEVASLINQSMYLGFRCATIGSDFRRTCLLREWMALAKSLWNFVLMCHLLDAQCRTQGPELRCLTVCFICEHVCMCAYVCRSAMQRC